MEVTVLMGVDELAEILHKSPSSIRSDASRNRNALPPICRLPGTKRLLFRAEDVYEWIAGHVDREQQGMTQQLLIEPAKRSRGRPRKASATASVVANGLARPRNELFEL
jgi:hypothetical protein